MKIRTTLALLALTALAGCGEIMIPAASSGGTTGDPVVDPLLPPAEAAACGFDASAEDPSRVALAWALAERLVLVRADGSSFVAHTFAAPSIDGKIGVYIDTRGDFIAASAWRHVEDTWEAILIRSSGEIVWKGAKPGHQYYPQHLSADGWLTIRFYEQQTMLVVSPDGAEEEIPGFEPLTARTAAGTVLVRALGSGQVGWLDLATKAFTGLAYPLVLGATPTVIRDGVVYVATIDGEPRLVRERAGEILTMASPAATPRLEQVAASSAIVLGDGSPAWENPRWSIDIGAGEATSIPQPEGLRGFGYDSYSGWKVDDAGGALAAVRDDLHGGIFRSDPSSPSWSPVGGTYREIWSIKALHRAGTFVLIPSDTEGYFAMDPWALDESGSADIVGPTPQVARPGEGAWRELPKTAGSFAIAGDGRCVAFVDEGALRVIEVGNGFPVSELLAGSPERTGIPVWLTAE